MFDHYYKGLTYSRPEAYYFWGYYVFMNFIWIVIPGSEWQRFRAIHRGNRALVLTSAYNSPPLRQRQLYCESLSGIGQDVQQIAGQRSRKEVQLRWFSGTETAESYV